MPRVAVLVVVTVAVKTNKTRRTKRVGSRCPSCVCVCVWAWVLCSSARRGVSSSRSSGVLVREEFVFGFRTAPLSAAVGANAGTDHSDSFSMCRRRQQQSSRKAARVCVLINNYYYVW